MLGLMASVFAPLSAKAYSYDHRFKPPYEGCVEQTSPHPVTAHPDVIPSIDGTKTMYWLASVGSPTNVVSNYITTGTANVYFFTYKSGVNLNNQSFCLTYCPANAKFSEYYVYGSWNS